MGRVIDSDQHLYESRTLWADHMDPGHRDGRSRIVDDDVGNAWVTWRGRAHRAWPTCTLPGETTEVGQRLQRRSRGERAGARATTRSCPASYWDPAARRRRCCAELGVDESVLFPNYGLAVGAHARGRPRGVTRQHGRVEPLGGRRSPRAARGAAPRRPPHPPRSRLARRPAGDAGRRGRAPGDDLARAGRREAAVAPRPRPRVGGVRRRTA